MVKMLLLLSLMLFCRCCTCVEQIHVLLRQVCANSETGVTFDPAVTFWSYLMARTVLGVLTAASLMMFEGAVMATIQVGNSHQCTGTVEPETLTL